MEINPCPVSSSGYLNATSVPEILAVPDKPFFSASVAQPVHMKDDFEDAMSQRTYMEMQPVALEPLRQNNEGMGVSSQLTAAREAIHRDFEVPVYAANDSGINIAELLEENKRNKELLKTMSDEIRELKDDQKFALLRIDRLKTENIKLTEKLDQATACINEVESLREKWEQATASSIKKVEKSREKLLLSTEFFHLKFLQLQKSVQAMTSIMSETSRFSSQEKIVKNSCVKDNTFTPAPGHSTRSWNLGAAQAKQASASLVDISHLNGHATKAGTSGSTLVRIKPDPDALPGKRGGWKGKRKGKRKGRPPKLSQQSQQEIKISKELTKTNGRTRNYISDWNLPRLCSLCSKSLASKFGYYRHQCRVHDIHSGACKSVTKCRFYKNKDALISSTVKP